MTNELELRDIVSLGTGTYVIDIAGTSQGNDEFDQIQVQGNPIDISGASIILDFGTFVPNVGDCFDIVNGNGRIGEFASITNVTPGIGFVVDYSDPSSVSYTHLTLPTICSV